MRPVVSSAAANYFAGESETSMEPEPIQMLLAVGSTSSQTNHASASLRSG